MYQATIFYSSTSTTSLERGSPVNLYIFIFHVFPGSVSAYLDLFFISNKTTLQQFTKQQISPTAGTQL